MHRPARWRMCRWLHSSKAKTTILRHGDEEEVGWREDAARRHHTCFSMHMHFFAATAANAYEAIAAENKWWRKKRMGPQLQRRRHSNRLDGWWRDGQQQMARPLTHQTSDEGGRRQRRDRSSYSFLLLLTSHFNPLYPQHLHTLKNFYFLSYYL